MIFRLVARLADCNRWSDGNRGRNGQSGVGKADGTAACSEPEGLNIESLQTHTHPVAWRAASLTSQYEHKAWRLHVARFLPHCFHALNLIQS